MYKTTKNIIDDGFIPELVEGARFDGVFEIPHVPAPKEIIIPKGMIPYSKMRYSSNNEEFINFYEHDIRFRDVITSVKDHIHDFKKFPGIISPDCSLYRDMPLTLQITNVYLSRAIGYYLWKEGLYSVPNIRWGDERSYTRRFFNEPFSFQGADKHSIVSIGTYGCIKTSENKKHFKAGLKAMLEYLEPKVVLVYGAMPSDIFEPFKNKTTFVQYDDWTKQQKQLAAFKRNLQDNPIYEDDVLVGYETYSTAL